ncbi:MAG: hypothetical protein A2V90_07160 [Gammaproteobacteria bacterium RBG_16_57_12]|nr:MAG: hypothetical protein A2V90_07160 [Gammaproteobacteria bacterium RBG_16_57_12]
MRLLWLVMMMIFPLLGAAEETADPSAPPEQAAEEDLVPQVTIIQNDHEVIKEHRVSGKLYMIEINPKKGRTYYLVDTDGDGNLETRYNDLAPGIAIPGWVLKRW